MLVLEIEYNEMDLVERKMPNIVDVPRLIAEVRKRPALWDVRHGDHKARRCVPKLWQEVAENVGLDVEQCKRKWKNLRDAFRAEMRRSVRRIERDKFMGVYDPNTNYNSKWVYLPLLSFLSESKQNQNDSVENENTNSNSNGNHFDETYNNDNIYDDNFHSEIKLEPSRDMDDDVILADDDDDDAENDMLFEEFQHVATPQAARRLSETLALNNSIEPTSTAQQVNAKHFSSNVKSCKCSKSTNDKVHFLEDLGREERKLIKSTRQDITRINKLDHIGDSDYNFLVSFLPQMKKMTELQNLQFRAKICETVLNILTPPAAAAVNHSTNALHSTDEHLKKQVPDEGKPIN